MTIRRSVLTRTRHTFAQSGCSAVSSSAGLRRVLLRARAGAALNVKEAAVVMTVRRCPNRRRVALITADVSHHHLRWVWPGLPAHMSRGGRILDPGSLVAWLVNAVSEPVNPARNLEASSKWTPTISTSV